MIVFLIFTSRNLRTKNLIMMMTKILSMNFLAWQLLRYVEMKFFFKNFSQDHPRVQVYDWTTFKEFQRTKLDF